MAEDNIKERFSKAISGEYEKEFGTAIAGVFLSDNILLLEDKQIAIRTELMHIESRPDHKLMVDKVNDFIRQKIRQPGIMRRVLPPVPADHIELNITIQDNDDEN